MSCVPGILGSGLGGEPGGWGFVHRHLHFLCNILLQESKISQAENCNKLLTLSLTNPSRDNQQSKLRGGGTKARAREVAKVGKGDQGEKKKRLAGPISPTFSPKQDLMHILFTQKRLGVRTKMLVCVFTVIMMILLFSYMLVSTPTCVQIGVSLPLQELTSVIKRRPPVWFLLAGINIKICSPSVNSLNCTTCSSLKGTFSNKGILRI